MVEHDAAARGGSVAKREPAQGDPLPGGPVSSSGPVSGEPSSGAPAPGGEAPPAARPRRTRLLLVIALAVFGIDLAAKTIVVDTLSQHAPIRLLGGFLTLRLLRNSGAAFSIGTSLTVVFTLIAVGVIIAILRTSRRLRSVPWAITLGLLLGGATGNLGDRLFRAPAPLRGDVVDWIQLPHWPVFNVADSAIVCGGVLAVLLAARGVRLDGSRETATAHKAPATADEVPPATDTSGDGTE